MFKNLEQMIENYKFGSHESLNLFKACNMMSDIRKSKIFFGCTSELLNPVTYKMIYQLIEKRLIDVLVVNADFLIFDLFNRENNEKISQDHLSKEEIVSSVCIAVQKGLGNRTHFIVSDLVKEIGIFLGDKSISGLAAISNINIYITDFCDSLFGLYFKDILIDQLGDCKKLNKECFFVKRTAAVVLGTSNIKHSILNANLFKNGLDHCVIVNSCNEMDCSDSGANVDEAVSWGKIIPFSSSVKVKGDPCMIFPILWHYWMKIYPR